MRHSYLTEDIESFYMLIGILVYGGYELDFDYMRQYQDAHSGSFLVLLCED